MKDHIEQVLKKYFRTDQVMVVDESEQHSGHPEADPSGGTHFRLVVISDQFIGKSRIQRHRIVYKALAEELQRDVHALAITTLTVKENLS